MVTSATQSPIVSPRGLFSSPSREGISSQYSAREESQLLSAAKRHSLLPGILPPLSQPEPSRWSRWSGTVAALVGTGVSVGLRAANLAPWTNALGYLGSGASAIGLTDSILDKSQISTVHRVAVSVLGQTSCFLLSQLYANTDDRGWQEVAAGSMVTFLGTNLYIYGKKLYDKRFAVRVEHVEFQDLFSLVKFERIFLNPVVTKLMKGTATAGLSISCFFIDDFVLKGVVSFLAAQYGTDLIFEEFCNRIDQRLERENTGEEGELSGIRGSNWRVVKTFMNSFGGIVIPFAFIPISGAPHSADRIAQLPIMGAMAGVFDGMMNRSQQARLEKVPIEDLEELQINAPVGSLAYRIYEAVWPTITHLGIFMFFVWQMGWDLNDPIQKTGLGLMWASFVATFGITHGVDRTWDRELRITQTEVSRWVDRFKDRVICFTINPRILGIHPAYFFFVGTNSLAMGSTASEESLNNRMIINLSWVSYGIAMGHEFQQTLSRRVGSQFKAPSMLFVNNIITMYRMMKGEL